MFATIFDFFARSVGAVQVGEAHKTGRYAFGRRPVSFPLRATTSMRRSLSNRDAGGELAAVFTKYTRLWPALVTLSSTLPGYSYTHGFVQVVSTTPRAVIQGLPFSPGTA